MRKTLMGLTVLGAVLLAAFAVGGLKDSSPAGAATSEAPVMGYTLRANFVEDTCELVTVDWATATVTDLPAAPTIEACAYDLAVAPDGTVHGFLPDEFVPDSIPSSAPAGTAPPAGRLVTYAADGTPTRTVVTLPQYYYRATGDAALLNGLAIDATGIFHLVLNGLWADVETCEPAPIFTSVPEGSADPTEDSMYGFVPCLFTLDPTTGTLTLVGSTRLIDGVNAGLSIGSTGPWSLAFTDQFTPVADPGTAPSVAGDPTWSTIDLTTGEGTPSANIYSVENAFFDQLRTRPTIFALTRDPVTDGYMTSTVDPTTGAITQIALLPISPSQIFGVVGVVELPEPDVPRFTG